MTSDLTSLDWQDVFNTEISQCSRCPRLVQWREQVARREVHVAKRYDGDIYWGKAVPTFGDSKGSLLIVGLAPAAHGANRTGRMFTGDRSGDWLYRALHKAGFANQPTSVIKDDGLALNNAMITAVCHCAPPDNKPLKEEIANCKPFLQAELQHHQQIKVILCLGKLAFDNILAILGEEGFAIPKPRPAFGHGVEYELRNAASSRSISVMGSYHPSQQNTFTGKLTEPMFDSVFTRIRQIL